MKIYTRTGDDGSTGLYGGARISKVSIRVKAIGDVDELNASLGVAALAIKDLECRSQVLEIQARLFDLGAMLANPSGKQRAGLLPHDIEGLEKSIDEISEKLPPLKSFILPGGSAGSSWLHLSRTVCRRAERAVLELSAEENLSSEAAIYLNRLSDWLFTAARWSNFFDQTPEVEWHPREEIHA